MRDIALFLAILGFLLSVVAIIAAIAGRQR